MVNSMCVRSNDIRPKNEGMVSISTMQSTNITAHNIAVNGLNGLQILSSIARPVRVIVMVIIVVMPSKVSEPSTSKQNT